MRLTAPVTRTLIKCYGWTNNSGYIIKNMMIIITISLNSWAFFIVLITVLNYLSQTIWYLGISDKNNVSYNMGFLNKQPMVELISLHNLSGKNISW